MDGAGPAASVTVRPASEDRAFANPLSGLVDHQMPWAPRVTPGWPPEGVTPPLVPHRPGPRHPYGSVARWYVPWDQLEEQASDPVDRLVEYADRHWTPYARRGRRVVPRVYLDFPQRQERRWPRDLPVGEYLTPEFAARAVALVEKMGRAWDGDPRLAWVETGIVGMWGEQHTPSPTPELQRVLGDAFDAAMPTTPRLRRYPGDFSGRGWGLYWDSYGCTDGRDQATYDAGADALRDEPDLWRRAVVSGEVAFDHTREYGSHPDEAVTDPATLARVVGAVRRFHATALGWISTARYDGAGRAGLDQLQCTIGYRFQVLEATVPRRVGPGGHLSLGFAVRNTGSAPFLRPWPVELSLVDPDRRSPVWSTTLDGVDVRSWMPGDRWDRAGAGYAEAAPVVEHRVEAVLEGGPPPGPYLLCLAVLDPDTGSPGLRFANRPYLAGGRLPLSVVGVDVDVVGVEPDPSTLDDLTDDPLPPVPAP